MLEDGGASGLDHIEYIFEPSRSAVVGIGNVDSPLVVEEMAQELDVVRARFRKGSNPREILSIHRHDERKRFEIVRDHLSRAADEGVTAMRRSPAHAFVSRMAGVIVNGAGRVDEDLVRESACFHDGLHDAFAGR